jgi:heterotetrameric sarcosine oxidase delta subunit
MFLIPCPHCGPRNVSEFRYVGARRTRPDPQTVTPVQWRAYLYEHDNVAGLSVESWYHTFGCRRFVSVERHTVTNAVRPVADGPNSSPPVTGSASGDSGAPDADSTS